MQVNQIRGIKQGLIQLPLKMIEWREKQEQWFQNQTESKQYPQPLFEPINPRSEPPP